MEKIIIGSILISGIANLVMGVVIVLGAKDRKESLPFALFSFSTFLVGLAEYFIYRSEFPLSVRLAYSLGVLIPTFLLAWIFNFSSSNSSKIFLIIYAAGALLFLLPFFDGPVILNIQQSEIIGFSEEKGLLFPLYVAFYLISYGVVLIKLLRLARNKESDKNKQARIISIGFFLYGAFALLFGLILPAFGYDRLTDLDIPATVIFVAFTTYAIVQYKWMNLKVIAVQLLAILIIAVALFEVFLADGAGWMIYKSAVFLIFTVLSLLLVKSVLVEIQRKTELQLMSDKLAQANDKLRKLDNEKTDFLSIASHQIRTPLTAIKGFLSLALEGSYGDINEKLKDALKKVYTSNERVVNLVEDLLNVSRIESGRMEFDFKKWKMENICQEVMDTLALKAKDRGLTLEYIKPDAPLPEVTIDGPKVREVISNLVDNAIKYTPKGLVKLELEQVGENIRVTVSDTGIGIPQSELPYLFAKFSRGKDTARLNTGGTGLGLYVCKSMIKNNGGEIWAESDGEGKGSRFIVELPQEPSKELLKTGWGGSDTRPAF